MQSCESYQPYELCFQPPLNYVFNHQRKQNQLSLKQLTFL